VEREGRYGEREMSEEREGKMTGRGQGEGEDIHWGEGAVGLRGGLRGDGEEIERRGMGAGGRERRKNIFYL
jgi:hypothetical protein